MEKQIVIIAIIVASIVGFNTAHAMTNDYFTPEPIPTLKTFLPQTGQAWNEITVFVNVCDARFNPDCLSGNRRGAMAYEPLTVDVYHINQETNEQTLVESMESKTNRLGYDAIVIDLDGKYSDRTQYEVVVNTQADTERGKFWVYTKMY